MFNLEKLLSIDKNDIPETAKTLNSAELKQLAELLSEKDDKIRYQAFLLLQSRSNAYEDVYSFWDLFCEKLKSENSYQRSLGLMLIAENTKWDKDNRFDRIFDDYSLHFNDEKPITIRQSIQALQKVVPYKEHLHKIIADKLMAINLMSIKETMRKLILTDIIDILLLIRKYGTNDKIEGYIFSALSGAILDKKAVKQIESKMK